MTDRYSALIVVLEKDTRSDDAEELIAAIQQLRGVEKALPHVADVTGTMAEERVRGQLVRKLYDVLKPKADR